MADASLRAQVADLLGEDPDDPRAERVPVHEAARACPRGELRPAVANGESVAVARLGDGSLVVVPDRCPHDGGLISDGFVDGESIVCARHGWEFDARTGRCPHRKGLQLHPCPLLGPVDS